MQLAVDFSNIRQRGTVGPVKADAISFEEREVDVTDFKARINNNFKSTKHLSLDFTLAA